MNQNKNFSIKKVNNKNMNLHSKIYKKQNSINKNFFEIFKNNF